MKIVLKAHHSTLRTNIHVHCRTNSHMGSLRAVIITMIVHVGAFSVT